MSSILFSNESDARRLIRDEPLCFTDLNMDQVVEDITAGRDVYDLKPFFYTLLTDVDGVVYGHEVFRDLEQDFLFTDPVDNIL